MFCEIQFNHSIQISVTPSNFRMTNSIHRFYKYLSVETSKVHVKTSQPSCTFVNSFIPLLALPRARSVKQFFLLGFFKQTKKRKNKTLVSIAKSLNMSTELHEDFQKNLFNFLNVVVVHNYFCRMSSEIIMF